MNAYAQSADAYLTQRVLSATPEQQAALLMEAGQRFLAKAAKAIQDHNQAEVRRSLQRVLDIISEADVRLNRDEGGELVDNLAKLYSWWNHQVFAVSSDQDVERIHLISGQMAEIRQSWEQLSEKRIRERSEVRVGFGDQTA